MIFFWTALKPSKHHYPTLTHVFPPVTSCFRKSSHKICGRDHTTHAIFYQFRPGLVKREERGEERGVRPKFCYSVLLKVRIAVVIMTAVKMARKARSPETVATVELLKRIDLSASTA